MVVSCSHDEKSIAVKSPTTPPVIQPTDADMTLEKLDHLVREMGKKVERQDGLWTFEWDGVPLLIVTDANANRMRILAEVARLSDVESKHLQAMLFAHFHSTLDARYAASGETLYSAFLHPLAELSEPELRSAISQVANLVLTFGTTYDSGKLFFGGESKPSNTPSDSSEPL